MKTSKLLLCLICAVALFAKGELVQEPNGLLLKASDKFAKELDTCSYMNAVLTRVIKKKEKGATDSIILESMGLLELLKLVCPRSNVVTPNNPNSSIRPTIKQQKRGWRERIIEKMGKNGQRKSRYH